MLFKTWQSRSFELTDYCEKKVAAEIVLINKNFRFI